MNNLFIKFLIKNVRFICKIDKKIDDRVCRKLYEELSMISLFASAILSLTPSVQAANQSPVTPTEQIRVLPVSKTPESNTVVLSIALPKNGEVKMKNPVWVQFRLDGYPLGAASQFERANEVAVSRMGQTVHVIIDDQPYFEVNSSTIDPFNEDGYFYDTRYVFEIPYTLKHGLHTIRMFPTRSYGESLKGENTFQTAYFYLGDKEDGQVPSFQEPFLTYNEPGGQTPLSEKLPILLDFYLSNCELTPDGYKVVLTVDGTIKRNLTSWQPYYIYGLKRGQHTIRLQLVDRNGRVLKGPFNDVERTINVRN